MELIDALRSTGAVRDFTDDPIDDAVLHRILDTARFAPNGGNRQGWHVVVVKDVDTRRALRDLYLPTWYEYLAMAGAGLTPFAVVTDEAAEREAVTRAGDIARDAAAGPGGFAEHFHEVPAMLVLLADLRRLATVDRELDRYTMVGGASIYPFAWSILLAARDEGLGGVLTTMVVRSEPEVKQLLGVPDEVAVAAVLALGRPKHQATRLRRAAVETFTTVDRYDGAPFAASGHRAGGQDQ